MLATGDDRAPKYLHDDQGDLGCPMPRGGRSKSLEPGHTRVNILGAWGAIGSRQDALYRSLSPLPAV